jgi:hypothetical protein
MTTIMAAVTLWANLPFRNQAAWCLSLLPFKASGIKLLRHARARPVKKDKKLNPEGDDSGLDEIESHELLIHDPLTLHLVRQCLASPNKGVQACFLYNIGYRLFISGNRISSLQILIVLDKINNNLSALLSSKLSVNLANLLH